jgi:hypothetical protein
VSATLKQDWETASGLVTKVLSIPSDSSPEYGLLLIGTVFLNLFRYLDDIFIAVR